MATPKQEVMLAQEQAVIRRAPGIRKGVEAAFAVGESEGTLVLTDRRLVYVHGDEKEADIRVGALSAKRLYFSDVESLNSMAMDSASVEVPLSKITKVAGHSAKAVAPKLEVRWTDARGAARSTEFVQQITGGSRRRNLNDWAKVIEKLKAGKMTVKQLPSAPAGDTLEGRVLEALGDMQEKGALVLEEEIEGRYKVALDPDDVEAACGKLVAAGLARRFAPKGEDPYYTKVSPLGEDDLSA